MHQCLDAVGSQMLLHHGALRERAGGPRPLGLGELLERTEDPIALTREIEWSTREDRVALADSLVAIGTPTKKFDTRAFRAHVAAARATGLPLVVL